MFSFETFSHVHVIFFKVPRVPQVRVQNSHYILCKLGFIGSAYCLYILYFICCSCVAPSKEMSQNRVSVLFNSQKTNQCHIYVANSGLKVQGIGCCLIKPKAETNIDIGFIFKHLQFVGRNRYVFYFHYFANCIIT